MRRAFTLIELMIVVVIMATMTAVGVMSVRSGQDAMRVRGATRDIVATIRHSRSKALVLMQPVVVTYSTVRVDGEVCAQVTADGAKLIDTSGQTRVQTLSGATVTLEDDDGQDGDGETGLAEGRGETISDILCQPISEQVVKGVRIKVTLGDERPEIAREEEKTANRISVFSNVDYLLGRYREKKEADAEEKRAAEEETSSPEPAADEDQEPVSVVWEANGRCDPHSVWVYLDGSTPDQGLCIKVDRFGATSVVSGTGEED